MAINNISPIVPSMKWTQDDNTLTGPAYDIMRNIFIRIGGSLSSLDATSLVGYTWSIPGIIGATTPNDATFKKLTVNNQLVVKKSVYPDGSGLKHKRLSGLTLPPGNSSYFIPWDTAFADTNYTILCSLTASGAGLSCYVQSYTASDITVIIVNSSAGTLTGNGLHILGIHD